MQLGCSLGSICLITCYGLHGVLYWTARDTGYLVPPELGNLTNLTTLALFNNNLTGSIPAELGNLTNLTTLDLYYNGLTGSIPVELGNLTNLTTLHLGFNDLTGSIPPELGNLTSLNTLALSDNDLTGPLPDSLLTLGDLQTLYFSGNDGLCAPATDAFTRWLNQIDDWHGPRCGGGDFQALSGLRINNDGSLRLQVGFVFQSVSRTGCIRGRSNINGRVYEYHWSAWQRNTGSGWSEVSGSRRTGGLCGYDLRSAPSGRYRLVGDLTIAGVRGRYKSATEVTR